MRKKKSTALIPGSRKESLGPADFIVLLICLAGVLFFLLLFRKDLYRSLTQLNDLPMGTITRKERTVQRRFVGRVLWDRLEMESPVYDGDFIRTADLSMATVTFRGGEVIELAENSMIQLFGESAAPRIDLAAGKVSVNTEEGNGSVISFSAGNASVNVAAGTVASASAGEDGNVKLLVSEGAAVVRSSSGAWQAGAGSAYSIDGKGAQGATALAAVTTPRPEARYINPNRGGMAVSFAWNRMN
jgi:ferric-dicitrate binding protein FerR (iron transport regulator)